MGVVGAVPTPSRDRDSLRGYFAALDTVIEDLNSVLSQAQGTVTEQFAVRLAIAAKSQTLLQGARLLLEESHWELAGSAARQLFELLVTIDYLLQQPDIDAAWDSYRRFGIASEIRGTKRKLEYAIANGYPDDDDLTAFEAALSDPSFDEFKNKNGELRKEWAEQTVRDRANLTAHRRQQYDYYYRSWSEETHASSPEIVRTYVPRAAGAALDTILGSGERDTRQLIVMLVALTSDLLLAIEILGIDGPQRVGIWRQALEAARKV